MKDKKEDRDSKTGQFGKGNQAALKSGSYSFKLTGKVPSVRGARRLMRELQEAKKAIEAITPCMNIKKGLLIDQVIKAQGFMRLFEMYCRNHGILNPRLYQRKVLDFQPGFRTYLSFAGLQHKALMALGLDINEAERLLTPAEQTEIIRKELKND